MDRAEKKENVERIAEKFTSLEEREKSFIAGYITRLEQEKEEKDYKRLQSLEEMQKQQSKCLAAMLNHQITGNGIEPMKKIRDELLESIIDK